MKYCDLKETKLVISVETTKLLIVNKFTYKNVSKDQKYLDLQNLRVDKRALFTLGINIIFVPGFIIK